MDDFEQKFYEDLRLCEKRKLRREFDGFSMGIIRMAIWILAYIAMLSGGVLTLILALSSIKRYRHFSGVILMNVGTFVFFSLMQIKTAKEKNLLKALGSKKQIIIFFAALTVSAIGDICALVFIVAKSRLIWLYWVSFITPYLGSLILIIPRASIKNAKKETEALKNENRKFFVWLKKEKNIIQKTQRNKFEE